MLLSPPIHFDREAAEMYQKKEKKKAVPNQDEGTNMARARHDTETQFMLADAAFDLLG